MSTCQDISFDTAQTLHSGDGGLVTEIPSGTENNIKETIDTESHASDDELNETIDESQFLVEMPDDIPELELTHCRLHNMGQLGLSRFVNIRAISMRQNLFTKIAGLESLTNTLTELDLYDNRISKIAPVAKLVNLEYLDLSFNRIRTIPPDVFNHLTKLKELFFIANKISKIENLNGLLQLRNLELGANKIRIIENLGRLSSLEQLWLGKNKITTLQNFEGLKNLKILSIQSNRITKIENLEPLENLEELYLSHNGISSLEGLEKNTNLRILDVTANHITIMENISHLKQLEEFWGNNNQFSSWDDLGNQLGGLPLLETVYLEGNPLQKEHNAVYRNKVRLAIPNIKQIDATFVRE